MINTAQLTTVTVTYGDSNKVNHRFADAVKAQKFAQNLADDKRKNIVSVLMTGVYGGREFIS